MVDIIAFGAHPDDLEFGCGGILAKMASQGKKIVMVDLTLGDKGSNGTPEQRKEESRKSAAVIGAKRVFLDFKDCEILDSYEARLKIVKVIREYKPRLVLAQYWKGEQSHPDHLAAGKIIRYACRYARFPKILPEIPVHWPEGLLHYLHLTGESDFLVDISDHIDTWKEMMACHESQMRTFDYVDWNLKVAAKRGMLINKPYAQGLVKGNPIVVDDLMTIAKGTREL